MNTRQYIPNFLTLLNLFCGCVALYFIQQNQLWASAYCVVLGIIFDFFDGFAARLLQVKSALGLQLDSLADLVTSGVVPGFVMFGLLDQVHKNSSVILSQSIDVYLPFLGFLITLASAYRLAKFNIDTRQHDAFIGLPTPANCILIISLPLIQDQYPNAVCSEWIANIWFLIAFTFFSCYLLNSNLHLFALKFKTFRFKENKLRYLFLVLSLVLVAIFRLAAIPICIASYLVFSIFLIPNRK